MELETLKRTQAEVKTELKKNISIRKLRGKTRRMNKAEDRILSLEDKVENLDQTSKEMTNLRKHRKGPCRKCEILLKG